MDNHEKEGVIILKKNKNKNHLYSDDHDKIEVDNNSFAE